MIFVEKKYVLVRRSTSDEGIMRLECNLRFLSSKEEEFRLLMCILFRLALSCGNASLATKLSIDHSIVLKGIFQQVIRVYFLEKERGLRA